MSSENSLERISRVTNVWLGSSPAFILALAFVLIWLGTGPIFDFSETWQLINNAVTSIVTFLMVFIIQRAQNKEFLTLHLKLNELVAAQQGASNRIINIEEMSEEDVNTLHRHYDKLADLAEAEKSLTHSHSIEEAEERHEQKKPSLPRGPSSS